MPVERTNYGDTHRALVESCQRGERRAQFDLYKLYGRAMYNVCLRMVRNAHDAEDVLQVAFVDIYAKIDTFNFESSIGAWIKRVVINKCIDHLKRRRLLTEEFRVFEHGEEMVEEETDSGTDPELDVAAIKIAVQKLPDGYRVVLSLYLFEGYDHEEIGQILNISTATSKSQYHRAKKRLRQLLAA